MKKVIKTYVGQLSPETQEDVRRQLEAYGLTEEQIQDAMDSKISDITGNPECPITIPEVGIMAASKLKVPSGLSKYYMLDEYGEYGDDVDEELQDILDSYELTFEGYAVAKDKYYDILADEGYDILFICKDNKGKNGLYYTYSDRVIEITPDEIEMLLERYE